VCSTINDDDVTITKSNVLSHPAVTEIANFAPHIRPIKINDAQGIADMGATSVFVKEGVPVPNKQPATNPLTVDLPDGCKVQLTHTCNVVAPRLLRPLVGHIVPNLAIASLFSIHPLCNAGCIVAFDKDKCDIWYDDKIILTELWNMSTDLWALLIVAKETFATPTIPLAFPGPSVSRHPALASFTHSIRTQIIAVKFAHQLLGNPQISTLLKAVRWGFLNGFPI
jgi:hypothetical protein